MTKFSILYEEWIDMRDVNSGYADDPAEDVDMFKNPSTKELKEAGEGCRGWISPKGDLYIGVQGDYIHADLFKVFGVMFPSKFPNQLATGNATQVYRQLDTTSPTKLGVSVEIYKRTAFLAESYDKRTVTKYKKEFTAILKEAGKKTPSVTFKPKKLIGKEVGEYM